MASKTDACRMMDHRHDHLGVVAEAKGARGDHLGVDGGLLRVCGDVIGAST